MEIERQNQDRQSRSEVLPLEILGGRVIRISQEFYNHDVPRIVALDVAENAGATAVYMQVQNTDGSSFNLLGTGNAQSVREKFESRKLAGDPFATNVFFQPGAAGPLFGLANRLLGKIIEPGIIEASIMGETVRVPLNHGLQEGQRPHHLHGVAFDKPSRISTTQNSQGLQIVADFEPGFHQPYWTGTAQMKITHGLQNGVYSFFMESQNVGVHEIPMGAGSHPYFLAPSGQASAVKLRIPGRKIVEIDNYVNVLPTGRILPIAANSTYDFNVPEGRPLDGQYLDNLWVDLETDSNGFAFAEFIDTVAQIRVRMTALTKNILGIQVYAPKPTDDPKQGVFAAIEFVTNLPDPREDLWGETSTGMVKLQPGQTLQYGYQIEVLPL